MAHLIDHPELSSEPNVSYHTQLMSHHRIEYDEVAKHLPLPLALPISRDEVVVVARKRYSRWGLEP